MDQRQTQIREGAGLEESRLNVEFIDLLRKWSSPVLLIAAVAAFGYWGWQKLHESRLNTLNAAFSQLEAVGAGNDPSPDSLRSVAAEYGTVRAVGTMANLQAADVYLRAVRLDLRVGAQPEVGPDGQAKYKPEDALTEDDKTSYLAQAETLYAQVAAENQGKPGMNILHRLNAIYGLAAVAECRNDLDKAKSHYEQVIAEAEKAGLPAQAVVARAWIEGLAELKSVPKLYNAADLPKPPAPPEPEPAPDQAPAPGDGAPAPEGGEGDPQPPSEEAPDPGQPVEPQPDGQPGGNQPGGDAPPDQPK